MKMFHVKRLVLCGLMIALCVVLPLAFHGIPNAGSIFSPMHIPALLCGLICGWPYGLVCGLMGPLLSSVTTGMPPAAYLAPMMLELAVYGLTAGLMMRLIRVKKLYVRLYLSLLTAMLLGRVVAGAAAALIFTPGQYTMAAWVASYFVKCLPAIVLQLTVVPAIYLALQRARAISPIPVAK